MEEARLNEAYLDIWPHAARPGVGRSLALITGRVGGNLL